MMKRNKLLFTTMLIAGLFTFSAFALSMAGFGGFKNNVLSVINNWDTQVSSCPSSYEKSQSWLDVGVRSKYSCMKSNFSPLALEQIFGMPVYIKGPHKKSIDLNSLNEFGHYNPKFLKTLDSYLKKLMKKKAFDDKMTNLYENELKGLFQTYYLSYQYVNSNNTKTSEIINEYKMLVETAKPNEDQFLRAPSYFLQNSFSDYSDSMGDQGYDIYEAVTAPGFWIRRKIDGTDKQFFKILTRFLKRYDPEFVKENEQ